MLTSICILSYNKPELTIKCVESIHRHTDIRRTPYEIVILDNGSNEETVKKLENLQDKNTIIIFNQENIYSPAGMNKCVSHSNGELVVTLDNDTEVSKGWLNTMLSTLKAGTVAEEGIASAQDIGVVAAYSDQGTYGLQLQPKDTLLKKAEVDHCALFCAITPRHIWDEIGGWDEDFSPGYYEDTYYCHQVKKMGYKVILAPVWTYHVGGGSFDSERWSLIAKNRAKYFAKIGGYNRYEIEFYVPTSAEMIKIEVDTRKLATDRKNCMVFR